MNNRKQILKNLKKERKLRNANIEDNENYIGRFIGTIGGILLVLVISYLLVGIFITKTIKFGKDKEEDPIINIDNTTILLGNALSQKDSEYYVIIYDVNDDNKTISNWLSYYKNNNKEAIFYTVDSKNKMNAKYIVEKDSNPEAKSLEDLKVIAPTIIKVNDGQITDYKEGDAVKEMLKN